MQNSLDTTAEMRDYQCVEEIQMTHEGARNEATRRTKALGTTHYVVDTRDGFLVLNRIPAKYSQNVVATVNPEDVLALEANTVPSEADRIHAENLARVQSPAYKQSENAIRRAERLTRKAV